MGRLTTLLASDLYVRLQRVGHRQFAESGGERSVQQDARAYPPAHLLSGTLSSGNRFARLSFEMRALYACMRVGGIGWKIDIG